MDGALDRQSLMGCFARSQIRGGRARGDHELHSDGPPPPPLVPAAVLVPIVDRGHGLTVLFTRRTDHLLNHAGQISFPGGHVEEGDASPEATALREAEEEIGLSRDRVRILGRLDRYVTRTGFSVTPVVGLIDPSFTLNPDAHEVAEVFEVPLTFFLDPRNHQRHRIRFEGVEREFHAMPWGDYFIWGATAGMLRNLYELLTRD